MATKRTKAKTSAKRASPKAKVKAKAKAAQTPRAKAKPKQAKPTQKAKPAPSKKPTQKRSIQTAVAVPPPEAPDAAPVAEPAPPQAKKGPLARLADGVGNLFARVTGKKPAEPARSPDQTIELSRSDILAITEAPPPIPKRKS